MFYSECVEYPDGEESVAAAGDRSSQTPSSSGLMALLMATDEDHTATETTNDAHTRATNEVIDMLTSVGLTVSYYFGYN